MHLEKGICVVHPVCRPTIGIGLDIVGLICSNLWNTGALLTSTFNFIKFNLLSFDGKKICYFENHYSHNDPLALPLKQGWQKDNHLIMLLLEEQEAMKG